MEKKNSLKIGFRGLHRPNCDEQFGLHAVSDLESGAITGLASHTIIMQPGSQAVPADPELLTDGPSDAARTIVLAHGAGAPMDSPFMAFFAAGLADSGFRVVRFEFPYMAGYRKTGKRKPSDRQKVLKATWIRVVEKLGAKGLVIGGKSMGGRIASLIADEAGVDGLIWLGYPFHPVGKPDQLRVEHLRTIKTKTLIVQGERDPFGSREEVGKYELSPAVRICWIEDGDHSFKPRKGSGRTQEENWEAALGEILVVLGKK